MNITCPHCDLNGKISEDKLRASAGKIRCPRCKKVFSPETVLGPKNEAEDTIHEEGIVVEEAGDRDMKFLEDEEIGYVEELGSGSLSMDGDLNDIDILGGDDLLETVGDDVLGSLVEEPLELVEPLDDDDFDIKEKRKRKPKEKKQKKRRKEIEADRGREDIDTDLEKDVEGDKITAMGKIAWGDKRARWRNILLIVFFLVLVSYGWSLLYPPYAAEKEFLDDSQALLGEYRKLITMLEKEIPNSVYLVKVAEMAYPYELYIEKYDFNRFDDPIYVSLAVTGRLFIATKSLLERIILPDKYFNSEWGGGFPLITRGQYVAVANSGLSACLKIVEKNVKLTRSMLKISEDFTFFSMMINKGLNLVGIKDIANDREKNISGVRKINKKVDEFNMDLPVLKAAADDIKMFTGKRKKQKE